MGTVAILAQALLDPSSSRPLTSSRMLRLVTLFALTSRAITVNRRSTDKIVRKRPGKANGLVDEIKEGDTVEISEEKDDDADRPETDRKSGMSEKMCQILCRDIEPGRPIDPKLWLMIVLNGCECNVPFSIDVP